MSNAIELFNCSLCSFCETSLDRLVAHIRRHIKPEPGHVDVQKPHTDTRLDKSLPESIKNVKRNLQKNSQEHPLSPRVEAANHRTAMTNEAPMYDLSVQHLGHSPASYHEPPPLLLDKSLMIREPARSAGVFDHFDLKTRASFRLKQPYMRRDFVPITPKVHADPLKKDCVISMQILSPVVNQRPVLQYSDKANPPPPQIFHNSPHNYIPSHAYNSAHIHMNSPAVQPLYSTGNRVPPPQAKQFVRPNAFVSNYSSAGLRHNFAKIEHSNNAVYDRKSKVDFDTSHLKSNNSTHAQKDFALKEGIAAQVKDAVKENFPNHVNTPNNATVVFNSEQLISTAGNMSDHAGVLVIPLKKTRHAVVQTDCVKFAQQAPFKTSYAQTDLHISQMNELTLKNAEYPSFSSTDELIECLACGDEFNSIFLLNEHTAQWHSYVCDNCDHLSSNELDHQYHTEKCERIESHALCMECNEAFTSVKQLNNHRNKKHNVRMPFRCGICNIPFECHQDTLKHIGEHETNNSLLFKCFKCTKFFQTSDALSKHLPRHKPVSTFFECRFCKRAFASSRLHDDHINTDHIITETCQSDPAFALNQPLPIRKEPSESGGHARFGGKKMQICKHCDLSFKSTEHLDRHTHRCSKNSVNKSNCCDVCKESFLSDFERKEHFKAEHKRHNGFRCTKCFKIYRTWLRLKFHTKQQHLRKICSECQLVFTKDHVLRKHLLEVHGQHHVTGTRVYKCSLCCATLYTLTDLMSHRKADHPELTAMKTADKSSEATMLSAIDDTEIHTNDEFEALGSDCNEKATSFACHKCDDMFGDENKLKVHQGLKHGDKPFQCSVCDQKFRYSSQLLFHSRSHNVAPKSMFGYYTCFCGAKFRQEKLLKNHKGAQHNMKLFQCFKCEAKLAHSTELIWHTRTCREGAEGSVSNRECNAPIIETDNNDVPPPTDALKEMMSREPSYDESRGVYICPMCNKTTASMTGMKTHYARVHQIGEKEEMKIDEEQNQDSDSNSEDMKLEESKNLYDCPYCVNVSFDNTKAIRVHTFKKHGIILETNLDSKTIKLSAIENPYKYKCMNCRCKFRLAKSIKLHTFKRHGYSLSKRQVAKCKILTPEEAAAVDEKCSPEEKHKCDKCVRVFNSYQAFSMHYRQAHKTDDADDVANFSERNNGEGSSSFEGTNDTVTSIDCPKCNRTFTRKKAIVTHMYLKHRISKEQHSVYWPNGMPQLPVIVTPCPKCDKRFNDSGGMAIHLFKAHGVKLSELKKIQRDKEAGTCALDDSVETPVCFICARSCKNHRSLITHEYKYHGIKWIGRKRILPENIRNVPTANAKGVVEIFTCSECSLDFPDRQAIETHLVHTHKYTTDNIQSYFGSTIAAEDENSTFSNESVLTAEPEENCEPVVE